MANVLGRFAAVRENGYFKRENEADIQAWREKMVREGRMSEEEASKSKPKKKRWERDDGRSQVLMEILQQETRIEAPDAWKEKNVEKRGPSSAPAPSPKHALQAKKQVFGGAFYSLSSALSAPGLSLVRHRNAWEVVDETGTRGTRITPTAYQAAVLERQAKAAAGMVGARAVIYGTLAAVVGVASTATILVHWMDEFSDAKANASVLGLNGNDTPPFLRSIREKVSSLQLYLSSANDSEELGLRKKLRDRFGRA